MGGLTGVLSCNRPSDSGHSLRPSLKAAQGWPKVTLALSGIGLGIFLASLPGRRST